MGLVTLTSGKTFQSPVGVSLLDAATQSKITIPYSCKTGRCRTCKCKLINGHTRALIEELGLTDKEKAEGLILSCARTAITDIVLEVEDLGDVILPEPRTLACRISHLEKLAPDIIKVVLRLPFGVTFNFLPGQYIDIIGPGGIRRSYSLASAPKAENTLELHIRAVEQGAMSQYWFNQSALNDLLRFHGPKGTFFLREIAKRDLIFLATGTGLAPVKAMLETISSLEPDEQPASITVVWGARCEQDLYFDVTSLQSNLKYIPVLSRFESAWKGDRGYVQDALLRHFSDFRNAVVYACGSDSMIYGSIHTLTEAGLTRQNFYSEAFVCSNNIVL